MTGKRKYLADYTMTSTTERAREGGGEWEREQVSPTSSDNSFRNLCPPPPKQTTNGNGLVGGVTKVKRIEYRCWPYANRGNENLQILNLKENIERLSRS